METSKIQTCINGSYGFFIAVHTIFCFVKISDNCFRKLFGNN
jgi:hypothetical protein